MSEQPPPNRMMNHLPPVLASLTLLLAGGVMVGWWVHSSRAVQVLPTLAPMQFNTALGLAGCAASLLLHRSGRRAWGAVAASVPLLLGVTALAQYGFHVDLGIDRLFVEPFTSTRTLFPGRMSVNSAVTFCIAAGASLILAAAHRKRGLHLVCALFAATALAIGLNAIFGYLAGVEAAFGWTLHSQMAVHTSAGFAMAGGAVLVQAWLESVTDFGVSPGWAAIPIAAGSLLMSVGLWQTLRAHDDEHVRRMVAAEAVGIAQSVEVQMQRRLLVLTRMARRWERNGSTERSRWEVDARLLIEDLPGFLAVDRIDRWGDVKWSVVNSNDPSLIDRQPGYSRAVFEALRDVKEHRRVSVTPGITLAEGGLGLHILVPLIEGGEYVGAVDSIHRIRDLLGDVILAARKQGYATSILDGDRLLVGPSDEESARRRGWSASAPIDPAVIGWRLQLWPTRHKLEQMRSAVPEVALALGLVLSAFLTLAVRSGRNARLQERRLWQAYEHLADEATERMLASEELSRSHAALTAVNDELESFAYSVSHDLRQPLRSMVGFSQILLEDHAGSLNEEGQDCLRRIAAGAGRMGELIEALLRLSRITRAPLEPVAVDLTSVARDVADGLGQSEPERKVQWEIEEGMTCEGDPSLLRVALQNLMGNAWKFTGNQPQARIEVGRARSNGTTEFYVRDNGTGFDMAYSDKLFAAFQRLHAVKEFPGTGIGLATVKRIVTRHGGQIRAEGHVGEGATFSFTL